MKAATEFSIAEFRHKEFDFWCAKRASEHARRAADLARTASAEMAKAASEAAEVQHAAVADANEAWRSSKRVGVADSRASCISAAWSKDIADSVEAVVDASTVARKVASVAAEAARLASEVCAGNGRSPSDSCLRAFMCMRRAERILSKSTATSACIAEECDNEKSAHLSKMSELSL